MPPQVEQGFEIFANWQSAVFGTAIFLIAYSVRKAIEAVKPSLKTDTDLLGRLYNELFLHILPIGTGMGLAVAAKSFPWPQVLSSSHSALLMYGAGLGSVCGIVYGRVRAFASTAGKNLPQAQEALNKLPAGDGVKAPTDDAVKAPTDDAVKPPVA